MDFVRSNFDTNEPLPVEHFFPHFLGRFAVCAQQTGQKVRKKVFNWQRFICTEVTSYKIHTLGTIHILRQQNDWVGLENGQSS